MECDFDCKGCTIKPCIYDVTEKHKPRVISDKQKAYWEKRKNTPTKRQLEAIEIYKKYQISGDKSSKEYKQAFYIVRYLRDRDKMLQMKKDRYKRLYLEEL